MNKFFKKFLPTAIITAVLLVIIILSGALLKENYKKDKYQPPADQTKNGNDVQINNKENNDLNNEENKIINSKENKEMELEAYEAELFIEAEWGSGKGEVGLWNPSEQGIEDAGPNYGPQSFDINESDGHLFLLDSINERIIEYDENGRYLRDFSIGIGATTDMKIKDECIYILSFGSDAVYKLDMSGKILEAHPITPGKNPGIGTGGIEFDENGNIMVHINIDGYYNEESRFYQIGKNGDEWKTNSYIGNITRDKKGFYFIEGVDWLTRKIQTLDRSGSVQKEFTIKLPQKAYVYYYGSDKNNIYLNVAFEHGNINDGYYFDEFIWKYNKNGKLLAKIDRDIFVKNLSQELRIKILSNSETNGAYAREFRKIRIINTEEIYLMLPFKEKGVQVFKYSKTE